MGQHHPDDASRRLSPFVELVRLRAGDHPDAPAFAFLDPLTVAVMPGDRLRGWVGHDARRVGGVAVDRLLEHSFALPGGIAADRPVLTEAEQEMLTRGWPDDLAAPDSPDGIDPDRLADDLDSMIAALRGEIAGRDRP